MTTPDTFTASVNADGALVSIQAPSLTVLAALLARLGLATPVPSAAVSANEKAAVLGNAQAAATPTAAPSPKPTAAPKPAATPAPTPPTATAAPAAAQGGVSYDDVKKVVNALYQIDPQHAVDALAAFKQADGTSVTNGKQLQPQQWPEFVTAAKAQLEALKAPA